MLVAQFLGHVSTSEFVKVCREVRNQATPTPKTTGLKTCLNMSKHVYLGLEVDYCNLNMCDCVFIRV